MNLEERPKEEYQLEQPQYRPDSDLPLALVEVEREVPHWDPFGIMKMRDDLMSRFGQVLQMADEPVKRELITKMKGEVAHIERAAMREGVDFSKAQLNAYAEAYMNGVPTEFESVSPYLADYDLKNGKMWEHNLMHHDAVGLAIARRLREFMPSARMISLYDEYNTALPESETFFGAPESTGRQFVLADDVKQNFREDLKRVFVETKVLKPGDEEGKAFELISESEKIHDAETLVQLLEEKGRADGKEYIRRSGEEILFVNPDMSNPAYREITMRTKSGRWICEALDASSYVKPENTKISHLVILPAAFREQQDRVWEMLRVLGIKPTNYHNIFYEPDVEPERAAEIIAEELKQYLKPPEGTTIH